MSKKVSVVLVLASLLVLGKANLFGSDQDPDHHNQESSDQEVSQCKLINTRIDQHETLIGHLNESRQVELVDQIRQRLECFVQTFSAQLGQLEGKHYLNSSAELLHENVSSSNVTGSNKKDKKKEKKNKSKHHASSVFAKMGFIFYSIDSSNHSVDFFKHESFKFTHADGMQSSSSNELDTYSSDIAALKTILNVLKDQAKEVSRKIAKLSSSENGSENKVDENHHDNKSNKAKKDKKKK
jgi:hypothetical protein